MSMTFKAIADFSECYKAARKMPKGVPEGIVVHSTGANNPNLKRYVNAPEICGYNQNHNYFGGKYSNDVTPHGVIGKDKDGFVKAAQILPYDICCWGCGSGSKGSYNYNPAYIQFEIAEDALTDSIYFERAFDLMAQVCAELMQLYPSIKLENIVSHKEANKRGYASSHGDPENWLSRFGKDMNWFREKVKGYISVQSAPDAPEKETLYRVQIGAFKDCGNAENYLETAKSKGFEGFVVRGDDDLLRVQIGAFANKQNAENYLEKAKAEGFDGFIVSSAASAASPEKPAADIKVGSTVTLRKGATDYNGGKLAAFVYDRPHIVSELKGDRAVITFGGKVVAAVKADDLSAV